MSTAVGTWAGLFRSSGPAKPAERTATWLWPGGAWPGTAPRSITASSAVPSPTDAQLREAPRAALLLGERATARGVGRLLRDGVLARTTGTTADPLRAADDGSLGLAVYRCATGLVLGTSSDLSHQEADARWLVGTLLPLPVWSAAGAWQLDVVRLTDALAQVTGPARTGDLPPESEPTRALPGADAANVEAPGDTRVQRALDRRDALRTRTTAAGFDAASAGTDLARSTLWNPYATLFELVELTIVLDPAARTTFGSGFWGALTAAEWTLVNATSAGHASLRLLWRWWGAQTGVDDLRTLLGLGPAGDVTVQLPSSVGDLEPPMPGVAGLPACGPGLAGRPLPVMAYGRRVRLRGAQYPKDAATYFGVSHFGTVPPADYALRDPLPVDVDDPPDLPTPEAGQQYRRILTAISATEARLDGASAWDRAVCSLGFQQWSMHVTTEGPALLERLKRLAPAYHDLVVGALGIETGPVATTTPSTTGAGTADLGSDHCFYRLSSTAAPVRCVSDDTGPGTRAVRTTVFGWTRQSFGWRAGDRAVQVAARWVVAARFGPEVWQAQADLAVQRIVRTAEKVRADDDLWQPIRALARYPKASTGEPVSVETLFGTEALMAVVVDMAINTPSHAAPAMRRAVLRTLAAAPKPRPGALAALPLDDDLRVRLVLAFLAERRYFATLSAKPGQHDARAAEIDVAPERITHLLRVLGDTPTVGGPALDAELAALVKASRIGDDAVLSWTRAVAWPTP